MVDAGHSPPSVGIGPAPFAFPCPSSLVSTPAPIASVDAGLGAYRPKPWMPSSIEADRWGFGGEMAELET